jgi:Archaea-specific editing domain of threonyl-tRNA synthetase
MKLLCFQAKRFRWQTHAKTLPEVPDQNVDQTVDQVLVVFIHAEGEDFDEQRKVSVLRQAIKHVKWLANKRSLKNIVLHAFAHLGGTAAAPHIAENFINGLAMRLEETGYTVWKTPFGYFCEWDLSVYGDSLAKVWKEIR